MKEGEGYFETGFTLMREREVVWKEICRYLQKKYIPPQARILDVGAGYGDFINHVHGLEKHALDIASEMSRHVKSDVFAHQGSVAAMGALQGDFFDVVFASNLFEHLEHPDLLKAMSEILRVLKPGGKLLAMQPNFRHSYKVYFDDFTHRQIFTHRSLPDLFAASGFQVIEVKPRFLPFSMKGGLPKMPLLVRLYLASPAKPFSGQMLVVAVKPPTRRS